MLVTTCFFLFKQKTAYEMRISDWSSDVCSSDLPLAERCGNGPLRIAGLERGFMARNVVIRRYGDRCRIPRKLRRSAELSDHSHARCQWVQELTRCGWDDRV